MASSSKTTAPAWVQPPRLPHVTLPALNVFNSLTHNKVPFVPVDASGRRVSWYCCGPTVYDAGHLGHARNYVTTDVLRRIMRDYFGFEVLFVQNVTDVDDKIIMRAREVHFFRQYVSQHPAIDSTVLADARKAFVWTGAALKGLTFPPDLTPAAYAGWAEPHQTALAARQALEDDEVKLKNKLAALGRLAVAIEKPPAPTDFYAAIEGVFSEYLGETLKDTVDGREHSIFSSFSQHWENHFNTDMRTLNVLPPTAITRVSEFIPENISFVEKCIAHGFAYHDGEGSVYFDIDAFESKGNFYARLEPGNRDNAGKMQEGEGALSDKKRKKQSDRDFALWKVGRPGEPRWPSPWGEGRPGWHIECSAMASTVLGKTIDIHSGGIDLAFPHHDNELAQSEAFWFDGEPRQWINYFLHMGHLSISGSKMSKSLKNFVTIRQAMETGEWTPRRLRAVFMMGGWAGGIEITPDMRKAVESWEGSIDKFFTTVKALLAEEQQRGYAPQLFREQEHALYTDLQGAQNRMHAALLDSFNTSTALEILADIVSKTNAYIGANSKTAANPDAYLSLAAVSEVARWVTRMVSIFGFVPGRETIGWGSGAPSATGDAVNTEEALEPLARVLSRFRDAVKQGALTATKAASPDAGVAFARAMLALSDAVRDDELPPLGIALEDRNSAIGEPALVKFAPAAELVAVREEKRRAVAEREGKKEAQRLERERAEAEKREKASVRPQDMFRTSAYGEWDERGIPTKDKEGKELSKSEGKKVQKMWEVQRKLHEQYFPPEGSSSQS
ncbi:tRNA synthetases class I (C) catalytic domain-containing protein [Auriculariales sp. MPI-PUGE-AT-0066]|nr:tRNA synthetases class I (C) catalytic domain-containing protein [Auriculariales sp. MPI-PUGE-AT-0066]